MTETSYQDFLFEVLHPATVTVFETLTDHSDTDLRALENALNEPRFGAEFVREVLRMMVRDEVERRGLPI